MKEKRLIYKDLIYYNGEKRVKQCIISRYIEVNINGHIVTHKSLISN